MSKPAARPRKVQSPRSTRAPRTTLLFWIGLAVLVAIAAAVAVFVGGGDDAGDSPGGAAAVAVRVTGDALPPLDDTGTDAAVGAQAPGLSGTGVDGGTVEIPGGEGARALLFLAHWCPHCRDEVPLLVDWAEAGGAPEGVQLYAVATANDPDAPNYPPAAWLEQEAWPYPTIVDDDAGTAAEAYGVTGFPFFVFVDAEGEVVGRHGGSLGVEALEERLLQLAARA